MSPSRHCYFASLVLLLLTVTSTSQAHSFEDRLDVRTRHDGLDVGYTSLSGVKLYAEIRSAEGAESSSLRPLEFNVKLEDTQGNRLFTSLASHQEPPAWFYRKANGAPPDQSFAAAQEMAKKVGSTEAPQGYAREWRFLKTGVLDAFRNYDAELRRIRATPQKLAEPSRLSRAELDFLIGKEHDSAVPLGSGRSSGGACAKLPELPRVWDTNYFFKQIVHLWSQPYKKNMHHSSTRTETWMRRKCAAGDPLPDCQWHLLVIRQTGNHGASPGQENMQEYQVCDPGVEIDGWYQFSNECEGLWGLEHTCNDDTAGQINNAYGVWTDHHCLGKRRKVRPWCGRHWG